MDWKRLSFFFCRQIWEEIKEWIEGSHRISKHSVVGELIGSYIGDGSSGSQMSALCYVKSSWITEC